MECGGSVGRVESTGLKVVLVGTVGHAKDRASLHVHRRPSAPNANLTTNKLRSGCRNRAAANLSLPNVPGPSNGTLSVLFTFSPEDDAVGGGCAPSPALAVTSSATGQWREWSYNLKFVSRPPPQSQYRDGTRKRDFRSSVFVGRVAPQ